MSLSSLFKGLIPSISPNPYYMLPRAELDAIPGGYNSSDDTINAVVSIDDRRQTESAWFKPGMLDDDYQARPDLAKAEALILQASFEPRNAHEKRVKIAREALKISQLCADAWCILAEHEAKSVEEALKFYKKGEEVGLKAVNDPNYKSMITNHNHGHGHAHGHGHGHKGRKIVYWDTVITRPFLRARAGVALCYLKLGKYDQARSELHQIIFHLNNSDNQGLRYLYIQTLLALGRENFDELRYLINGFPGEKEQSAFFTFSNALIDYIDGDQEGADERLTVALKANPHVADLLINKTPVLCPPSGIAYGNKSEALAYVYLNQVHWNNAKGALEWLAYRAAGNMPTGAKTVSTITGALTSADAHFKKGEHKEAVEVFTKAIDSLPPKTSELSALYFGRGKKLLQIG